MKSRYHQQIRQSLKWLLAFITIFLLTCGKQLLGQQKMRIISYNIEEGMKADTSKGKKDFVAWIKSLDPDIMALEECNKFTQASLEELAHSYGHPYAIIVKEKGYPTAITSKYPIVNVQKITDNMTHGFITCKIKDLNVVVLHLNPHQYQKRREEIAVILNTIAASPEKKKWLMMGDFNSISPLDKDKYADGKLLAYLIDQKQKHSFHANLVDDRELDYQVQQQILDFGLKDTGKAFEAVSKNPPTRSRIDYIYVSRDLMPKVTASHFIVDEFTAHHSDHKPMMMEFENTK
ncbi:endonuclease/exonuclease/phosphatase family protein [Mucilaginibacter sp. UR6-11]|uniref:endonuclease/exonuclease/phosphatase family protein n=1 Tax=Mucilaginibacter sp. UR6-11 TaxID=1435644 RepID=UPI001E3240A7|nr:endonuclease/exonuclease/phosphatase family protein [Mucilaginibacter sp. UR6-11]MCC8424579.1 endonuclease/exonuclease/phosphatase family protein [Mucilaginibacter sp. UR6-11]